MMFSIRYIFIFLFLSSYLTGYEIDRLSLDEKIGQLFIAPVPPRATQKDVERVIYLVEDKKVGSVIFMEGESALQKKQVELLKQRCSVPLLTFQDCEKGVGMRLSDVPSLPKNLTLGAITDLSFLQAFGKEVAAQCRGVGIVGSLAPVVDVNSNPKNLVIGQRSFGEDPYEVAQRAVAVMRGIQEGGVLACAKHFPGHGGTYVDSHYSLPIIQKSLQELKDLELIPFQAMIDEGVDMVMMGHLLIPSLSDQPSSLSYEIITELLREEMGFEGVIVTDALNMRALTNQQSLDKILLQAFEAGADLLLVTASERAKCRYFIEKAIPKAIDQIKQKCLEGEIDEAEIDRRVQRVVALRKRVQNAYVSTNCSVKQELFHQAVTVVGERFSSLEEGEEIALVQSKPDSELEQLLIEYSRVKTYSFEEIEEASNHSNLIFHYQKNDPAHLIPKQATILLFDTPYLLESIDHKGPILVGYENEIEAKRAVVKALFGKIPALGKLPVQISKEEMEETTWNQRP